MACCLASYVKNEFSYRLDILRAYLCVRQIIMNHKTLVEHPALIKYLTYVAFNTDRIWCMLILTFTIHNLFIGYQLTYRAIGIYFTLLYYSVELCFQTPVSLTHTFRSLTFTCKMGIQRYRSISYYHQTNFPCYKWTSTGGVVYYVTYC